ncbi:TPA: cysteine desulfurase NifS [bacterium]|nr:cysteine desulfurase NifS [bacterium]
MKIYLDHAATTPLEPSVLEAMKPYFCNFFGNPSSTHSFGKETKEAIEDTRYKIARFLGANEDEIVFTSSGTEANNLAIKGVCFANKNKNHIITSQIEHHSVLEVCHFLEKEGFSVTYLPVDSYGFVSPDDVKKAITKKTILISIMHANNEIGTIEDIEEIGKIAWENDIYFHTDCVQTCSHIPLDVNSINADLVSISAHKLYGPKGVGALYIRRGTRIKPLLHGGGHEKGLRSSTENTPGIVGFGKAIEIAEDLMQDEIKKLTFLRDKLINGIMERVSARLNGHPEKRLPCNVNVSIKSINGEKLLLYLDREGIAASSASACSSSNEGPSHVLNAIGVPEEFIYGSIRFTLGRKTSDEEIDYVLDVLPKIVQKIEIASPIR